MIGSILLTAICLLVGVAGVAFMAATSDSVNWYGHWELFGRDDDDPWTGI